MPLMVSKCRLSHVCSLLIGQLGWVKHRDTELMSFVLYYSLPPSYCLCPFSCSPDHCWQQTSLPAARALFFCFFLCWWRLLSELKLHCIFRKAPFVPCHFWCPACWVGVACHRALVSPQWLTTLSRRLQTDRCWLTNQRLSTTNLCCGPSRLTAFCVTVIERNRWSGTAWNWPSCFIVTRGSLDRCCCYSIISVCHDNLWSSSFSSLLFPFPPNLSACTGDQNRLCSSSHQR